MVWVLLLHIAGSVENARTVTEIFSLSGFLTIFLP